MAQAALVESPSSDLRERITQSLHILISLQDRAELALDIIWKGAIINLMWPSLCNARRHAHACWPT